MVHALCSKCQVYRSPCQHRLFTEHSLCKYLKVWSCPTNIDFLFAMHAKIFVIHDTVPAQLLFNIQLSFQTSMLEISILFQMYKKAYHKRPAKKQKRTIYLTNVFRGEISTVCKFGSYQLLFCKSIYIFISIYIYGWPGFAMNLGILNVKFITIFLKRIHHEVSQENKPYSLGSIN